MVQLLLERGADIHAQDFSGNNPLHVAIFTRTLLVNKKIEDIVRLLLKENANYKAVNDIGKIPEQYAIHLGLKELASIIAQWHRPLSQTRTNFSGRKNFFEDGTSSTVIVKPDDSFDGIPLERIATKR